MPPGHDPFILRYIMRATTHPPVHPLVGMLAADRYFELADGLPPALARFTGLRKYAGQQVRIE